MARIATNRRVLAGLALLAVPAVCGAQSAPDLTIGDITTIVRYGPVSGVYAYSVGVVTCNTGSADLQWVYNSPNHPVFVVNMYRLQGGRFEQVGRSWARHGVVALAGNMCAVPGGCNGHSGSALGAGCSDPHSASAEDMGSYGWRSGVDPATGLVVVPAPGGGFSGTNAVSKRCRVGAGDIAAGAAYFVEVLGLSSGDAAAARDNNNASYRSVAFTNGGANATLIGATMDEQPAVLAWQAADPSVRITTVDLAEGRLLLAAKAVDMGAGLWRYDYSLLNLQSRQTVSGFRVPLATTATDLYFHDPERHSGEPVNNADWESAVGLGAVEWLSPQAPTGQSSSQLRWGELATFSVTTSTAPADGSVRLTLDPALGDGARDVQTVVPGPVACPCDWDGQSGLESQDYFAFVEAFFAGAADINLDGGTDSQDLFDFLECFFGSTCGG